MAPSQNEVSFVWRRAGIVIVLVDNREIVAGDLVLAPGDLDYSVMECERMYDLLSFVNVTMCAQEIFVLNNVVMHDSLIETNALRKVKTIRLKTWCILLFFQVKTLVAGYVITVNFIWLTVLNIKERRANGVSWNCQLRTKIIQEIIRQKLLCCGSLWIQIFLLRRG